MSYLKIYKNNIIKYILYTLNYFFFQMFILKLFKNNILLRIHIVQMKLSFLLLFLSLSLKKKIYKIAGLLGEHRGRNFLPGDTC